MILTCIVSSDDLSVILEICWRLRHTERSIFLIPDCDEEKSRNGR